jgi:hypothetical protein
VRLTASWHERAIPIRSESVIMWFQTSFEMWDAALWADLLAATASVPRVNPFPPGRTSD